MTIKYSALRSLLKHSPAFQKEIEDFLRSIEEISGFRFVESPLEDYDCDLKLLFVQTGGSEGVFLQNLPKLKPPYYLLTNGGNNSLAASLEILTFVKQHGESGEILHGDIPYIAERIAELSEISAIRRKLSSASLGVIGKPSDWLISSVPSERILKDRLGITLKYFPLTEAEEGICTESTALSREKEFEKAYAILENIRRTVENQHLSGITIRCFDLLSSIKMTGCLAVAKLNDAGIIAACEGDIAAMVSMYLVKVFFDLPSFQANPSRINTNNNEIVFAHCTVPYTMLESYEHMTHFESGIGLAIRGKMQKGPVTVFRLSSSLSEYTVMEGCIVENLSEDNLCRTQICIAFSDGEDVTQLLKKPCGNHHIIFYGHHKAKLQKILENILY